MLLRGSSDALLVLHVGTEEPEEDEEEGKTREDDAHGEDGDAIAVRVGLLEYLWLAESCGLWKIAWGDICLVTNVPSLEVTAESV